MKFGMVTPFDPLKPSDGQNFECLKIQDGGRDEMPFVGQTRVHPKNHVLVVGAHWRILANTSELSVRNGQGWAVQKQLNRSRRRLGAHSCGPNEPCL